MVKEVQMPWQLPKKIRLDTIAATPRHRIYWGYTNLRNDEIPGKARAVLVLSPYWHNQYKELFKKWGE